MATTRKDYEAIAAVINNVGRAHRTENNVATLEIAQGLADYFATDNPDFNRARFISACFKYQQEPLPQSLCAICGHIRNDHDTVDRIRCGRCFDSRTANHLFKEA